MTVQANRRRQAAVRPPRVEPLEDRLFLSASVAAPPPTHTGSVAGVVFEDANANRRRDAGEAGLTAWLVWADLNDNGRLNHNEPRTVSDAHGRYVLAAVPAGVQSLRLEPRAGWQQTYPRGGGKHAPTVVGGKRVGGWDFGVRAVVAPPPVVLGTSIGSVGTTSATLRATVDPAGSPAAVTFQFSTDRSFAPTVWTTVTEATGIPTGVAVDRAGNLFVSDYGDNDAKRIGVDGSVRVLGSTFGLAQAIAVDPAGRVFVLDHVDNDIKRILPNGKVVSIPSGVDETRGLASDAAGNLFVSDYAWGTIHKVSPDGRNRVIASGLSGPWGMAVDAAGNVFVAEEYAGVITKVAPGGRKTTVAQGFNMPTGVAVDAAGNLFVVDTHNDAVVEVFPDGTSLVLATGFGGPQALAVDAGGNVFVADTWYSRIVRLSPPSVAGTPSPVTGSGGHASVGQLTGLRRNTTYYYRAVASGPGGTTTSAVGTFRTGG